MDDDLLIGAHMSISGGVEKSLIRGESVGCKTIQIFTKSSNQWKAKNLLKEDIERFHNNKQKTGITNIVAHDSYLINLASPKDDLRQKSFEAFVIEMERCRDLGIKSLVMHPGSHTGAGEDNGLKTITDQFNSILNLTKGWDVNVLLETTAGQGTNLGYKFEHLAYIIDNVDQKDRLKICFDTCHVFAAGYDISNEEGYNKTMDHFEKILGLDKISVFHLNDSKKGLGSRVDRHEHLGNGELGENPFRFIMNDARFHQVPKILETPKGKEMEEDKVNLALLRSLAK